MALYYENFRCFYGIEGLSFGTGQVPESLASFKNTIRKLHADLEAFPFNKETVVITYFWQQHINDTLVHSVRTWRALY